MADQIVIDGIPPYDGRYELDLEAAPLTSREWGWLKRLAGYLPLTIQDGFGDPELLNVLAAVAVRRAGKAEAADVPAVFERLQDAPFGDAVTLITEVEEDVGVDPPMPGSSNGSNGSSGDSSPTSSETPATTGPSRTGSRVSATSESGPERSAS